MLIFFLQIFLYPRSIIISVASLPTTLCIFFKVMIFFLYPVEIHTQSIFGESTSRGFWLLGSSHRVWSSASAIQDLMFMDSCRVSGIFTGAVLRGCGNWLVGDILSILILLFWRIWELSILKNDFLLIKLVLLSIVNPDHYRRSIFLVHARRKINPARYCFWQQADHVDLLLWLYSILGH